MTTEHMRMLVDLLETVEEFLESVDHATSQKLVTKAHDLRSIVAGFKDLVKAETYRNN